MSNIYYNNRLDVDCLEGIFKMTKKVINDYVREIDRHCRFKSAQASSIRGTILDDRGKLIDLYEACLQQDAHLASVRETLMSKILGERYMLCTQNEKGRYIKDVEETKKIQGTQFSKIITGIMDAKLFGYTGFYIANEIDGRTGRLREVAEIPRRNILPDQERIVRRQGIWMPGWDFEDRKYSDNYFLINTGGLGLFSATTPLVLAKKFTFGNYVNFSHTYGQPIIHGKTEGETLGDRQRLADEISSAAQNKVIVTGLNDEVDIKTFTMSNSEKIFTGLIGMANAEVSNVILGSESMAGATQAYVGSTRAHQDILRDRIAVYREYIENMMNECVIPRLVTMGFIKPGLIYKYSKELEMSNQEQIQLFSVLSDRYEITPEEVEKTFGVNVGKQLNTLGGVGGGASVSGDGYDEGSGRHLTDEEYYRRYGHRRGATNFITGNW